MTNLRHLRPGDRVGLPGSRELGTVIENPDARGLRVVWDSTKVPGSYALLDEPVTVDGDLVERFEVEPLPRVELHVRGSLPNRRLQAEAARDNLIRSQRAQARRGAR